MLKIKVFLRSQQHVTFLMEFREGEDPDGGGSGVDLGGAEGEEAEIRIYCLR